MATSERIAVVGSGASGVHFALSLLRKGLRVTMFDIGRKGRSAVAPELSFAKLREDLEDPSRYFLGDQYEGVLLPDADEEFYGIPPSKDYVFDGVNGFDHQSRGFAPLFSFARGGLAEAWTAGCYPMDEQEVIDFPFKYQELAASYSEVAARIGVTGEDDDLARFMPLHGHLLPPLKLDAHSRRLMDSYAKNRDRLNRRLGAYIGRTRVATLSQAFRSRKACGYLGRCLWGCPVNALYTPSQTLDECRTFPTFEYLSGLEVDHFKIGAGNRVRSVVARPLDNGPAQEFDVDRLALAAGTLLSSKIFLQSWLHATGESIQLRGLMDNRQILAPFVNLGMIGKTVSQDSYQYHLLGMGIQSEDPREYVHGQITTLKTAMMHPIIQKLPFDLRTSTFVTRALRCALGVVNVNFRDTRRDDNYVALSDTKNGDRSKLVIHYAPSADEPTRMRDAMGKVKRTLRALGCVMPPGMAHMRPMGASVHYAGTLPMSRNSGSLTTTEYCQSRDFDNLFLVDGSTFPFLPAKNLTFTLMANAVRIAEAAF